MKLFADKLNESIHCNNSVVVAGFDPIFENLPEFIKQQSVNIKEALLTFHLAALRAIKNNVAAIKINTAFFEQYGLEGLSAMQEIAAQIKECKLPLIADAKRGDIGSTAKAYSSAFLGESTAYGKLYKLLDADALTVNPFLGFDTLESYLSDCIKYGKGIFVLVRTSNPGSGSLQSFKNEQGVTISDVVANWVYENSQKLIGTCGYSGLGAVVGATYPQEAVNLRKIMHNNFFLIPGYGAQGGTAEEALSGFAQNADDKSESTKAKSIKGGAIINISRALFANISDQISDTKELEILISERLKKFNADINSNLKK